MAATIERRPINIFIEDWGALILLLIFCAIGVIKNLRVNDFGHAKSYIITGLVIMGLYMFRFQIGDLLIGLFQ